MFVTMSPLLATCAGQAAGISRAEHAHIKSLLLQYQQEDAMGSSDTNGAPHGLVRYDTLLGKSTAQQTQRLAGTLEVFAWAHSEYSQRPPDS